MPEKTDTNRQATEMTEAIRRYRFEQLSNMGGYLSRVAEHPITEVNRHEELSWEGEHGREAID